MATPYPADNTTSLFVVKIEKSGRKRDFKHQLSVERHNHPSAIAD
jgi:phosphoribosylformylglycinamidine (FGAM) synthase-like enzyme